MRPTYEILVDMESARQSIKEATARFERYQVEFLDALRAERQATPLTQAEQTLLTKLSHGPIESGMEETPSTFTREESELLWKLQEKGFAHYRARSWTEGTWTITDEGRKKLQQ